MRKHKDWATNVQKDAAVQAFYSCAAIDHLITTEDDLPRIYVAVCASLTEGEK